MNLRKTAFGIGVAVAVIIIAILLLQHNVLRTGIPWIEKRPKIIVLRPEGFHAHFIEPGVVYRVEASHFPVYTTSDIDVLTNSIEIWLNVSKLAIIKGQPAPPFFMMPGRVNLEIDKPGHYIVVYRPLGEDKYYISILVNDTYNCTITVSSSIRIITCDLPYSKTNTTLYVYLPGTTPKEMKHCITVKKGNMTGVICGIYNRYQVAEIDIVSRDLGINKIFGPEFLGDVTFRFRVVS